VLGVSLEQFWETLRSMARGPEFALSDRVHAIDSVIRQRAPLPKVLAAIEESKRAIRDSLGQHLTDPAAATALTLKLLNLLLAKYHFQERSAEVTSRPFGLLVDPSNGCNLGCPGCVQSTRSKSLHLFDWASGMLPVERFATVLDRYGPHAMQIMFCNYGEPTLNSKTPELIAMAKAYLVQTALSTNLSFERVDAEAYVRSGLDFMFLAIDGASQEVYGRYRKRGDIGTVYRNVQNLVAAKRRLGKQAPILRWQYLAFEHNAHEIEAAREMAGKLGLDQFVVEIPFDVSWDDPEIHPANVEPLHVEFMANTAEVLAANWQPVEGHAAEVVEREFQAGWTRFRANDGGGNGGAPHTCSWLYKSMTLDANGRILPCCGAPKAGSELVFGKLGDGRADEFNSERYMQARRLFADRPAYDAIRVSGGPAAYCAECQWNQDHTEFGASEVAQYLRTVGQGAIDAETIAVCGNW
jgi:MoaA/NifB/PqqE/SkfB family radical SAM enzyme